MIQKLLVDGFLSILILGSGMQASLLIASHQADCGGLGVQLMLLERSQDPEQGLHSPVRTLHQARREDPIGLTSIDLQL
jgi:hypothetical protein